jgi:hypothetical protein
MSDGGDGAANELLARARRGWSPGAADLERVRRGVARAVALGLPPPAAIRPRALRPWMGRVLVTAAFTAAGAGAGYWAGLRAERRAAAGTAHSAPVLAAPLAPPARALPPPSGPAPAPPAAPVRRAEAARRHPVEPPPGAPAESLAVEVRGLRNVERALRDRNPGLAAAFLDDLDRQVPGGQMRQERAALRTIARCTAGDQPFGLDLAGEFQAAYPGSAYAARVEQACRGTDSAAAGDSAARR